MQVSGAPKGTPFLGTVADIEESMRQGWKIADLPGDTIDQKWFHFVYPRTPLRGFENHPFFIARASTAPDPEDDDVLKATGAGTESNEGEDESDVAELIRHVIISKLTKDGAGHTLSRKFEVTEPGAHWPRCGYCFRSTLNYGHCCSCAGRPCSRWCELTTEDGLHYCPEHWPYRPRPTRGRK